MFPKPSPREPLIRPLPLVSLCLSLLQYTIALSPPSLEDKLQAAIAQSVPFLLAFLLTLILALFLAIPRAGGADRSGVIGLRRRMPPHDPAAVARGDARLPGVSA
jgi:hypothetical protein